MNSNVEKIWNKAISLSRPSFEELQHVLNVEAVVPVFAHTPSLLFAGNNILITLQANEQFNAATLVESISLILVSNFFSSEARVRTVEIEDLKMFDIPLAGNASQFLGSAKVAGLKPLELSAEIGRWTIRYARALSFEFYSFKTDGNDPHQSRIHEINFNYCVPFDSCRLPVIVSGEKPDAQ